MKIFIGYALIILSIFSFYLFQPQSFDDYTVYELSDSDLAYVKQVSVPYELTNLSKRVIRNYELSTFLATSIKVPYTTPSQHQMEGIFERDFSYNRNIKLDAEPSVITKAMLFKDEHDNYYLLYSYVLSNQLIHTNFSIKIKPQNLNYQLVLNDISLTTKKENYLLKYDALTYEDNMYHNRRNYQTSNLASSSFEGALLMKLNDFDPNYFHVDIDFYEPYQENSVVKIGMNSFNYNTGLKFIPSTQRLIYKEIL